MSTRPVVLYVDGALIQGFSAHVIDRILNRYLPRYLDAFSAQQRAEVEETIRAIRRAADRFEETPAIAACGSTETHDAETTPPLRHEWISTSEAAVILAVGERRARQLAAGGMGRKVGHVWLLDRSQVLAHREERQGAA